jgi:hypothetical protein
MTPRIPPQSEPLPWLLNVADLDSARRRIAVLSARLRYASQFDYQMAIRAIENNEKDGWEMEQSA